MVYHRMNFFLVMILLFINGMTAKGQNQHQLTTDPGILQGKLKNGMKYIIWPSRDLEGKASMFLIQNSGARQELPGEYGYAHFVEHMQFQDTRNFKDNQVLEYLRSIGVNFGVDANAFTFYDQTIYQIDKVADARKQRLDSCMMIIKDWAMGPVINDKALNKEKNVIIEEWRTRGGEKTFRPIIDVLEGSAYNHSMLGDTANIRLCNAAKLKAFVRKWYQPQLQTIAIIGDVDARETERKIQELFSNIPQGKTRDAEISIPRPTDKRFFTYRDVSPMVTFTMLTRMPETKSGYTHTTEWQKDKFKESLILQTLQKRMQGHVEEHPGLAAFFYLFGPYNDLPNANMFMTICMTQPGQWKNGFEYVLTEQKRIADHGVTQQDIDDFVKQKKNELKVEYDSIDSLVYDEEDSLVLERTFDEKIKMLIQYVKCDYPMISKQEEASILKEFATEITPEDISEYMKKVLAEQATTTIITLPMNEENQAPDYSELTTVINQVSQKSTEQLTEKVRQDELADTMKIKSPIPLRMGKIVKTKKTKKGFEWMMLDNGVEVVLHHTDDEEIHLKGQRSGGNSLISNRDAYLLPIMSQSMKKLDCENSSHKCSDFEDEYDAHIAPDSIEYLLKNFFIARTTSVVDKEKFEKINLSKQMLPTMQDNLVTKLSIAMNKVKETTNRMGIYTQENIERINADEFVRIAQSTKNNYRGTILAIEGNYNRKTILPLIKKYFGSLPAKNTPSQWIAHSDYKLKQYDDSVCETFKNQVPIAITAINYHQTTDYTWSNRKHEMHEMLGQIMSQIVMDKLRLKSGEVYTPNVGKEESQYPTPSQQFVISYSCDPKREHIIRKEVMAIVHDIAYGNLITDEIISNYKKLYIQNNKDTEEDNNEEKEDPYYDIDEYIEEYYNHGCSINVSNTAIVKTITRDEIRKFAQELLKKGHIFTTIMTSKGQ